MDQPEDLRKIVEGCLSEIWRVSGQDTMEMNIKDIKGSSLALVLEKARPGFVQASAGPVSKGVSNIP
jgi:cytoskeleton-associated protein 5